MDKTIPVSSLSHPEKNREVKKAWEKFLGGMDYSASVALRPAIDASWRRCRISHVDPARQESLEPLPGDSLANLRQRHQRLLAASAPCLVQARSLLARTGTVIILTDPEGTILDVEGDPRLKAALERTRLVPGAPWSESASGTNAIGTTLALGYPVQVHGFEHFCEGMHQWTCSAASIRDPASGSVLGVLDISGLAGNYQRHSLPLATMTAGQIEQQLAQQDQQRRFALLERGMRRLASIDGVLLVDGHGNLVKSNARAAVALAAWGVRLAELTRIAALAGHAPFTNGDACWPEWLRAGRVEPIFANGDLLGFAVALPLVPPRLAPPSAAIAAQDAVRGGSRPPLRNVAHTPILAADGRSVAIGPQAEVARPPAEPPPGVRVAGEHRKAEEEGVLVADGQGRILTVNPAFTHITGYSAADAVGKTPRILKSGLHSPDFYARMWHALSHEGRWQGEIQNRRKNGEIFPEWLTIYAIKGAAGVIQNYIAIFGDASALAASRRQLGFLASHDALTGLPNRKLLLERLTEGIAAAGPGAAGLAIMAVGLDRFRDINDSLGHDAGDQLLQQMADRLRRCLCNAQTIGRIGDDEFAVVLFDTSLEETRRRVAATLDYLSTSYVLAEREVSATASAGISLFPGDGQLATGLLKSARTALRAARREGKNGYRFFARDMAARLEQQIQMETALRDAIREDRFRIVYQPQDDLASGAMVGAEALLRWHDPALGEVPPARFIPVAEESGLIAALGDLVLDKVLSQIDLWRLQGLALPRISINVAAQQLRAADFPAMLQQRLDEHHVPPEAICIELTEGTVMEDLEQTSRILGQLNAGGIAVSIDDFGTGYSSLAYLSRLPIQELKVDQSFVRGLAEEANNRSITTAIIDMAHALKLRVLAEGIETEAQLAILRKQSCELGQGYLFHRPLSTEAFERLLTQRGTAGSQAATAH